MMVGEPEKAVDQLEPLLRVPHTLSPCWLRIDPTWGALLRNPRFQKADSSRRAHQIEDAQETRWSDPIAALREGAAGAVTRSSESSAGAAWPRSTWLMTRSITGSSRSKC